MKLVLSILAAGSILGAIAVQGDKAAHQEKKDSCCATAQGKSNTTNSEKEFLALAEKMKMGAEGKKACCKSTTEKVVAKGEAGCCTAKGETAKFKVYVAGAGYKYFGCEGSAKKGRAEFASKGHKVGDIQKVTTKVALS